MKASYFLGNKTFELRETELSAPGFQEVTIRVAACGVCGTDVHIFYGEKGSAEVVPPVVLGHEFAGIVEQVGLGVTALKVGDHVTVDPNLYCGECRFCRSGKKQMCERLSAVGVTRDGGFAQYCRVPAKQCFVLNPKISLETGAMAEPIACCIHGIDRVGIRTGDTVLVIGGGAIGLIMVQLARLAGASQVVLSEPVEMRRTVGLTLGATAAVDPRAEDLNATLKREFGADGADVVIECVGHVSATAQAISAARKGGAILLFSVPRPDATVPLPLIDVFQKELSIYGSFINPDTHQRAVDLINAGLIQMEPIITHRFQLDRLEDAIAMQTSAESLKVIVVP